jgi:hypothetical protein
MAQRSLLKKCAAMTLGIVSAGSASIWRTQGWSQSSRSGQRLHAVSFRSACSHTADATACPTSTRTATGFCVSGQTTTLAPWTCDHVRMAITR